MICQTPVAWIIEPAHPQDFSRPLLLKQHQANSTSLDDALTFTWPLYAGCNKSFSFIIAVHIFIVKQSINRIEITPFTDLTNSKPCLFYTSDAADDLLCVDLGGRRSIK